MKLRIYQPAKTAMQSGRAKTRLWKIAFEEASPKFVEPLMGWVGMRDMQQELDLTFDTEEEAIAYAKRHGYEFTIVEPSRRRIRPKSYAENFRYNNANA